MADDIAKGKPQIERISPAAPRPPRGLVGLVEMVLNYIGEVTILAGQSVGEVLRGRVAFRDVINQMAAIGADSLGIVLIITTATGAVFALYAARQAVQIGFTQFVGGAIAYTFFNELGPVLGGVALASRVGAAIAAEIGSMVVTEQIDALRAMAVSPVRYLVAPRVVAAVLMLPLLTVIADVAGLYGGSYTAGLNGVLYKTYWDSVRTFTHVTDLNNGLIKAVVFGFLIGIVACRQGLSTSGGAAGVGRATTRSVVLCVVLIFVFDLILAQILTGPARGH